ncbi:zinc finger SWIM domain-containing protein 7 isoform X2 [Strix uralensis]|uniref:zinc finger SWIM domain-containing protein 7 isoform X2 n=1 Tax=Strix uralensis TaxID=36305 RepID=UPI003DA75718
MRARASPGAKGACCYGDAPSWLRCHSHEASANGMDSTLPAVAEELLKEIKKAFQETSHVPDDLLLGHDAWAVTGGGIHNQLINNLIQGNSSRPPAEVHLWPMCCPSFGFGGSPFCHSSHVPQWKDCIPGPWELRQTLHLLQFLPLLHVSCVWFYCTAEEREPSVQTYTCCLPQSGHGSLPGTNCL